MTCRNLRRGQRCQVTLGQRAIGIRLAPGEADDLRPFDQITPLGREILTLEAQRPAAVVAAARAKAAI